MTDRERLLVQLSHGIRCLKVIGDAYRGDWSDFDGRSLKAQLLDVVEVLEGKKRPDIIIGEAEFVCAEGGVGHWFEHCESYHPKEAG